MSDNNIPSVIIIDSLFLFFYRLLGNLTRLKIGALLWILILLHEMSHVA